MVHRPLTVGTKQVQVHLVDLDTRELVAGWLVTTSSAAPIVSRTYDVDVTVGKSAHKKIAYGTGFCLLWWRCLCGGVWSLRLVFFNTIVFLLLFCLFCSSSSFSSSFPVNKWDRSRNFRLRTSDPDIVKVKDPRLNISGRGKGFIRLWFAPVQHAGTKEMFIFVNDEEDQNEECLMLRLTAN